MAIEQWDRIARLLENKQPVQLEVNSKNNWYDADEQYDTIAEIAGTDKKDEVVMQVEAVNFFGRRPPDSR